MGGRGAGAGRDGGGLGAGPGRARGSGRRPVSDAAASRWTQTPNHEGPDRVTRAMTALISMPGCVCPRIRSLP